MVEWQWPESVGGETSADDAAVEGSACGRKAAILWKPAICGNMVMNLKINI